MSVTQICQVETCGGPSRTLGMCPTHYARHRLGADIEAPVRRRSRGRTCKLGWRQEKHFARGYCASHKSAVEKYNLPEEKLHLLHGVCDICGEPDRRGRRLSIDHDHSCCPGRGSCGRCVRGFLCWDCNRGLGVFGDSSERMRAAADYLDRSMLN